MNLEHIIMGLLTLASGVLGWFARELYSAMQALRRDLVNLEVQINRDYIRYDRLQDALHPIMTALAEIKHALDGKANK